MYGYLESKHPPETVPETSNVTHTDDFTLMSPFDGAPTRGSEVTSERLATLGGSLGTAAELELVQSYGSADMVVLAIIERQRVEVGGLPDQDWSLRVTLVYRREGSEWRLARMLTLSSRASAWNRRPPVR